MKKKDSSDKNWRDDPPTEAQQRAISNMWTRWGYGFNPPYAKTKGEAADIIASLKQSIRLNHGSRYNSDYDESEDWLDPIY